MTARAESATPESDEISGVRHWLARHRLPPLAVQPLTGDVSSRRYFRVSLAGVPETRIVARYPAEMAPAQQRFASAAALLSSIGVRVPELRLDDPESGYALLEDVGQQTIHERYEDWSSAREPLESALTAADAISRLNGDAVVALGSPPLDARLLRRELGQTTELLIAPAGLASAAVETALDALCERLGDRPLVPCHRDFMARNLVPLPQGGVAVLDFQDLRFGPVAYDLASLLNDSLFAEADLEASCRRRWTRLAGSEDDYRAAVVQRSLKAVGTYLAFARRGQRRHLQLVVPTLERALSHFAALPELHSLGGEWRAALRAAAREATLC